MKKIFFIIILLISGFNLAFASVNNIEIISRSSDGTLGNSDSSEGVLSADGNFIIFSSSSSNIVPDDTNGVIDIFIHNIEDDTAERITVNALGEESDGDSQDINISDDGRYIVFSSAATNLVPDDTNNEIDIFLYDLELGEIELVSVDSNGILSDGDSAMASISSDGRYIVFESVGENLVSNDTNNQPDVFLRDTLLETTERVSLTDSDLQATGFSYAPAISPNGRFVAFISNSTNMVSGDTNGITDYFLRDTVLDTTERINVSSLGAQSNDEIDTVTKNSISSDGRYVVFSSLASNLVTDDTNGVNDIFVRDRELGVTERITLKPNGEEADDTTTTSPSGISPDGRYVSFYSGSPQFVEGDTTSGEYNYDVFVRDLFLDVTRRVSISVDGEEANGDSYSALIAFANGGRYLVFNSSASNLVENDTNGSYDTFYVEVIDEDGIVSNIEDSAPNSGDVDESGYDDAIEQNVTPFINSVTNNYSVVKTTGECIQNNSISTDPESALATQDPSYDYPLGIITFSVDCKDTGETATVSVYCFCENTPVEGTLARKYNESTGEYTTIDSAVIEEVTIDGQRALKMTYDVVDGGALDEDGLENGTIVDPVGFARVATVTSSGGSSSGSRPRTNILTQNTVIPVETQNPSNESCLKYSFTTLMKKGSKFGEVLKLQQALNALGFNSGIPDGLFGPLTDTAVKAFQKANTLDSDGIVGPMTRGVLNGECL